MNSTVIDVPTAKPKAVAWRVEINSLGCIVFAATKAKAKWIAVRSWREAGYGHRGEWPSIQCGRRPDLDGKLGWRNGMSAYVEDQIW